MNNSKILIILFKYPPYSGVGAFRWSKIIKYLAKECYILHIITVKWKINETQSWINDINNPNIIIHKLPSFGFHNYKYWKVNNTFIGKIINKIRYIIFKYLKNVYYIDEAQFWGFSLIPFCKRLIKKENITKVIATGSPFMANYWAAKLKQKMPFLKLIQDFRDPWNVNPLIEYKNRHHKNIAVKNELFAINSADTIVTVTRGLLKIIKEKIYNPNKNKYVLTNGYDDEVVEEVMLENKGYVRKCFTLVHVGNITNRREECLVFLLDYVLENYIKYNTLKIKLYGKLNKKYIMLKYSKLIEKNILQLYDSVCPKDALKEIYKSFFALQLNADIFPYLVSTKIYEYAALYRPVLSINYGGEIEEIINKHRLGYSVNLNIDDKYKLKKIFNELYKKWKKNKYNGNKPYNIKKYSYRNITKKYIKKIKKIK